MKFIINGKAFAKVHKTGVQRYCIEILNELDKQVKEKDIELIIPKYCNEKIEYKNIKVKKIGNLKLNLWEQITLPIYAKKKKGILINLCNTSPLLEPGIVCIHDLNFIKNKQYYPKVFSKWYSIMIKNSIKKAKKIITVSNFSKKEIEEYYKISNIPVIYNSYDHIKRINPDNTIFEKLKNIEKNEYYFTLGTIQKSKNIEWILHIAKKENKEKFVITGYKNQKQIDFNLENVIYTGYLTDEEIKALMQNCKAYIMPSFYEGFGIPALEAFSLGKKIIVSDIPVMHEIYGDEVTYINPRKYEINFNELVESQNREKILEKFSWKKSAQELLKIINEFES